MPSFHFPLAPLIAERERDKQDAVERLAAARLCAASHTASADRCNAAFEELRAQLREAIGRRSIDLASIDDAQARIGRSLRYAEQQLEATRAAVRLRERDLARAAHDWMQLELLRRRARERYDLERRRDEERDLDEQNLLARSRDRPAGDVPV
jgi:hypothetical protein